MFSLKMMKHHDNSDDWSFSFNIVVFIEKTIVYEFFF